jgi:mortality factor 4-like protein 1
LPSWDDWVPGDRVRQLTENNRNLAKALHDEARAMQRSKSIKSHKKGAPNSSLRGSEDRHSSATASTAMRGHKRNLNEREIEDGGEYLRKDQVASIPMSDALKNVLVDDWENVTKYKQVLVLPAKVTVRTIMQRYEEHEAVSGGRGAVPGSYDRDLLEEVVAGILRYFEKCLPRMLLYKLEKEQYASVYKRTQDPLDSWANKPLVDIYGGQHLLRLFTALPELLAHTALDEEGINRLRVELTRVAQWMAHPAVATSIFMMSEYVSTAPPEDPVLGKPQTPHGSMLGKMR